MVIYHGLSLKQKKFADEYIISGNATQSAIAAGYTKKYANTNANKLLQNTTIKKYIDERLTEIDSAKIAKADEILKYWTSVMRGESVANELVVVGCGEGESEAKIISKPPNEKERLQASRELAKRIIDTQANETKEDKLDKLMGVVSEVYSDG